MKRRDNKKNLRKMKSSHGIVSFLLFFLGLSLFLAVLASVLGVFLSNIISNKIDDEYSRISRDAEVYENSSDDASLMSYLKMKDRIWIVRDRNGSVMEQNGENSCGKEKQTIISASGIFSVLTENRRLVGYEDIKDNALSASNGVINIDMGRISDMLSFSIFMGDEKLPEPDDAHIRYLDQDMVKLPYWISIPLKDGNEFIGKAYFMIGTKDLMFLVGVILVLAVFILFMTIFLIGKLIRNIVRNRRISHIFYTDEVTKGKNRMWFLIKGEQFLKRRRYAGHSFAIVSISMIRYSNFCMCHSIAEGEALLTAVMNQLSCRMNKNEMAVHYGNAEFALLLFTDKEDQLKGRLNALLGLAERANPAHRCAFHAGVAILPPNIINAKIKRRKYLDLESVYNNACAARATLAEKEDSAVAFFDTKLLEEQRWIETVQEHQARALANEEFVVYYQPKYSPDTEELKGAEALIRWQSPEFGFISPGRFIPIFEKNGFITEIDHYMLRHVAMDQKRWLDAGKKCVPVSVNVSRAHFIEPDLAEQIRDLVDECGAPRELIEIELTESAFFDDKMALIGTLNRLKSYGFTVSMDDFGSGYSSLNSLKDMALDVLKLDAEFFRSIPWTAEEQKKSEAVKAATAAETEKKAESADQTAAAEAETAEAASAAEDKSSAEKEVSDDAGRNTAEAAEEEARAMGAGSIPEDAEDAAEEESAAEGDKQEAASGAEKTGGINEEAAEKKELPAVVAEKEQKESPADERARIVVTEAIRLARRLNMRTVAEGVEQKDQVDFLAEQGCDMIQGYYFAKPMPGSEYEQRLK